MDIAKAFDKVPHQWLLYKLKFYGIKNQTLNWISVVLSSRTQTVVMDGESTDIAPVTSGVPRGTFLGPVLFPHSLRPVDKLNPKSRNICKFDISYTHIHDLTRSWHGTGTSIKWCEWIILNINIIYYKELRLVIFLSFMKPLELSKKLIFFLYYYFSIIIWPFLTVWIFHFITLFNIFTTKTFYQNLS